MIISGTRHNLAITRIIGSEHGSRVRVAVLRVNEGMSSCTGSCMAEHVHIRPATGHGQGCKAATQVHGVHRGWSLVSTRAPGKGFRSVSSISHMKSMIAADRNRSSALPGVQLIFRLILDHHCIHNYNALYLMYI